MQTASIVIVFDEFLDALDQVFQIAVVAQGQLRRQANETQDSIGTLVVN
jgi:hypothetical protein